MAARNNTSVQSLTRGIAVLRALAERGAMTATELARELKLHQSSASRILRSLELGGFVHKPDFHSFALDYGVLMFAGSAMEHFDEIGAAAEVCTQVHEQSGYGTACAVLHQRRLIYLARVHPGRENALVLVDNSNFPIYQSAPALVLAHARGKREMRSIVRAGLRRHPPEDGAARFEDTFALVEASVRAHGFLFLRPGQCGKGYRASRIYETRRGPAAFTVFTGEARFGPTDAAPLLEEGCRVLEQKCARPRTGTRR